jgi:L-amino acid N-acyltransferase YncA
MRFELKHERFPSPDGGLVYASIPWDSELFGFPFYELFPAESGTDALAQFLPQWLTQISKHGKCLVTASLPPVAIEHAKTLAKNAFYPVETLIEIHLPLSRFKPLLEKRFDHLKMFAAEKKDLPDLIAISQSSFHTDRFHLDKNLSGEKAGMRYARWIEEGFRSGDYIFVLKDMRLQRIAGFVLARESKKGVYDMSLAALDKNYHNSGAGVMLYQAMLVTSREKGCKLAVAWISINNLQSLKAAERLGFVAQNAVSKFHWFHNNTDKH